MIYITDSEQISHIREYQEGLLQLKEGNFKVAEGKFKECLGFLKHSNSTESLGYNLILRK
jgi:hypothetical protein